MSLNDLPVRFPVNGHTFLRDDTPKVVRIPFGESSHDAIPGPGTRATVDGRGAADNCAALWAGDGPRLDLSLCGRCSHEAERAN